MELLATLLLAVTVTMSNFSFCDGEIAWKHTRYNTKPSEIRICTWYTPKETVFFLVHELGHEYWFKIMTDQEREEYNELYNKRVHTLDVMREYGKKNVEEDFADIFALVILKKKVWYKSENFTRKTELVSKYIK